VDYRERSILDVQASKDPWIDIFVEDVLARIDACLGDRDRAISALERILKSPGQLTPALLRLDPDFDPLRADARFQALVDQGRIK